MCLLHVSFQCHVLEIGSYIVFRHWQAGSMHVKVKGFGMSMGTSVKCQHLVDPHQWMDFQQWSMIGPPHCSSSGNYPTLFKNLPLIPYDTPRLDKPLQASTNPTKQFWTILQNFKLYQTSLNYFATLRIPSVIVLLFLLSTSPRFTPISHYCASW